MTTIVVSHNNVHIPKESWPNWIWYVAEFFIVLAVAHVIAFQVTPAFEQMVTNQGFDCIQESHLTKCLPAEEASPDENILNWIFYSIVAIIFLVWYIAIRGLILKKKILENR